jgi:beta-mannosidase
VLASFRLDDDGGVELWITNDTADALRDTGRVRLGRFDGTVAREEDVSLEVASHESRCVKRWDAGEMPGDGDRYLAVRSAGGRFPANRRFFAAIKDLRRERGDLRSEVEAVDERQLAVRLRSDRYAYFVHVSVPDETAWFSDNYFELEPGEERTIVVTVAAGSLRPEDVAVRWR